MGLQILSEPIFILYLDSVSRWDWFSIAFYPQSSIVIFTFSINELAHLSRTPNETDIYCPNRGWQNIAAARISDKHTGAELIWGIVNMSPQHRKENQNQNSWILIHYLWGFSPEMLHYCLAVLSFVSYPGSAT